MFINLDLRWWVFVLLVICVEWSEQNLGQGETLAKRTQQQQRQLPTNRGGQQQQHQLSDELRNEQIKLIHLDKSQNMLRYMNRDGGDVCKDFYEYSCGNWLQSQNSSLVRSGERWSVGDLMERQLLIQIQNMLTEPPPISLDYNDTVVRNFYRSCLQASPSSSEEKEYIRKFVEYHGGLPYMKDSQWQEQHYNWIDVLGQLKHRYNLDILIQFTIPKTKPDRGIPVPILEEPKNTILPPHLCSYLAAEQTDEKDHIFNGIQLEIKDNLKAWLDLRDPDATRLAGDIQRFEFELCKYMRKRELRDLPYGGGSSRNRTYGRHSQIVPNTFHGVWQPRTTSPNLVSVSSLEDKYNLEFPRFVQISLGKGHSIPREFYFRDEDYFQHLGVIARKGLTPSFAYYIMYRALTDILLPRQQSKAERPYYCAQKSLQFFPDILGGHYQMKYRQDSVLKDLSDILDYIKRAFMHSVDTNVHWLQDSIRKDIKQRSWKIKEPKYPAGQEIIFNSNMLTEPEASYWKLIDPIREYSSQQYLQQLSIYTPLSKQSLEEFVMTYSTHDEKRIQFSWALLQPPFYDFNYPKSLKFSSVGYIMAREMVKYFDQQGWYDSPGALVNIWNDDTVEQFHQIKECFRVQSSNYLHNSPNTYRNGSQLRDFIADTSAVDIAFAAYINWLQDQNIKSEELLHETLPNMDYTNTQLFFLNFAQSRCSVNPNNDQATTKLHYFPMARHNLERWIVNGPLSNGYEFGRDFQCRIGSDMNVDDKCRSF
ncbi:endothelin-converting enzyme homolog [Haematobia irritans]|uniref:endothelin-converting enzyme homolog n=1 Tax=Haematobia irritans TaxID=7368 RepID=UPI003F505228